MGSAGSGSIMRFFALLLSSSLVVACDATSSDAVGETEDERGSTGTASTTGITTTGPVSSAGGGDTGGGSSPPGASCETCIGGACGSEVQACLADDRCTCWLDCSGTMSDEQCVGICGDPGGELVELYQCVVRHCAEQCASAETTGSPEETETGAQESSGTADAGEDSTGGEAESTETTR
jgi:hypothetical protein